MVKAEIIAAGPKISLEVGQTLVRSVTDEEIKAALFDIGDSKAPRPDGFSAHFKHSWNVVGDGVTRAVREFFTSGLLLKELNHTTLVLIPKGTHSSKVGDYHPITCCKVVYKIISKILANRLAPTLSDIVDKAQSAFVKGRSLAENVHLAQELVLQYYRKRISPRCVLKVDLRKAYDTIDWNFLQGMLIELGYPPRFVGWVMECVTTTSYSLSINGELHGYFKGKRGLRQGDPISPFLFVICMEYLSRLLLKASRDPSFQFHPKCAKVGITHLAFADDIMLFGSGELPTVRILWDTLKEFGRCSGLEVSVPKSNIYCGGVSAENLKEIVDETGLEVGDMPFRYLGIPLAATRLKIVHFEPLLNRVQNSLKGWKGTLLSYAGRTELIRTVLQGVECFWLSILPIPCKILDQLTSLCMNFLWNYGPLLVRWKTLCLPKEEGGLGLRDSRAWNDALLSKALWNIHAK